MKKVEKERRAFVERNYGYFEKLSDQIFLDQAVRFAEQEIRKHYSGQIDLVVGECQNVFFNALVKKLGAATQFERLRPELRLDQEQMILQVQEVAFRRSCLERVRRKIYSVKHSPTSRQLVPVAISIVSSCYAIEIEGCPVVSLNNGCPCCKQAC